MNLCIITTTINVPTVLDKWLENAPQGVGLIVTGDLKTPHRDAEDFLIEMSKKHVDRLASWRYLPPKDQEVWASSEVIGWNSIQRRNIALLEAMSDDYDLILTVDDDNAPMSDTYFTHLSRIFTSSSFNRIGNSKGWINPGAALKPRVYHRGFPYSQRDTWGDVHEHLVSNVNVGVAAGLWLGDPDVDAIDRATLHTTTVDLDDVGKRGFVVEHGVMAPFNSQNTCYLGSLAPLMMCWPGVGRFDDIWASYFARWVMDQTTQNYVHYGHPLVYQDRNPHSVWDDMEREMFGYRHTDELVEALRATKLESEEGVWDRLSKIGGHLAWFPTQTLEAFDAWKEDMWTIVKGSTTI